MHENVNKSTNEEQIKLGSIKAINLKDSDLKISTFAEWWVVECQTSVCLAIPNVLIHPDGLSFSGTKIHVEYK